MKFHFKLMAMFFVIFAFIIPGFKGYLKNENNSSFKQYMYKGEENPYPVSDFWDLKDALETNSSLIILTDDISLNYDQDYQEDQGIAYYDYQINPFELRNNNELTIDGQGHKIMNKNSTFFFEPVITSFELFYSSSDSDSYILGDSLTIKNLDLDNVGTFIGEIVAYPVGDVVNIDDLPNITTENIGINFQNITIENNNLVNQEVLAYNSNYSLNDGSSSKEITMGLLANNIKLEYNNQENSDIAIRFYNINIINNVISQNAIKVREYHSYHIKNISFSFLTNIFTSSDPETIRKSNSFITFDYIFIKDNQFTNNVYYDYFQIFSYDDDGIESIGNIIGNISGVENYSDLTNYIFFSNIFIQHNVISSSPNISLKPENFRYSELISNTKNPEQILWIGIERFDNIFSFNNEAYIDEIDQTWTPLSPEKNIIANIGFDHSSNFHMENINASYFYGDLYDESVPLNVFNDYSNDYIKTIYYGKYLLWDNRYAHLDYTLSNNYGNYTYEYVMKYDIDENGEEIAIVDGINIFMEDDVELLSFEFLSSNGNDIDQIKLQFKLHKSIIQNPKIPNESTDRDEYTLNGVYLLEMEMNDDSGDLILKNKIAGSDNEYNPSSQYIYDVVLNIDEQMNVTEDNLQSFIDEGRLENIYLAFDLENSTNLKGMEDINTYLKIDSDEIINAYTGFPLDLNSSNNSANLKLILISLGIILFLLFLLILVLFIFIYKKRDDEAKLFAQAKTNEVLFSSDFNSSEFDSKNFPNYYNNDNFYQYISNENEELKLENDFINKDDSFNDDETFPSKNIENKQNVENQQNVFEVEDEISENLLKVDQSEQTYELEQEFTEESNFEFVNPNVISSYEYEERYDGEYDEEYEEEYDNVIPDIIFPPEYQEEYENESNNIN